MRYFIILLTIAVVSNSLGKCAAQTPAGYSPPGQKVRTTNRRPLPAYDLEAKRQRVKQVMDAFMRDVDAYLTQKT